MILQPGKQLSLLPASLALLHVLFLGLMAGFFYAYSVDVMPALDMLEPPRAIEAMQAINEAVRNPVFFTTFFLTPLIGLLASALLYRSSVPRAAYLSLLAVFVYGGLAFLPTAIVNVPMNEALAMIETTDQRQDLMSIWTRYSEDWTFWNTLRSITTSIALVLAGIALVVRAD